MLRGKQKRYLRALAVNQQALYQVGKSSLTENVLAQLDEALAARELIKVRVLNNCDDDAKELGAQIAAATNSELVQVIGHNLVFYRASKQNPVIQLP